jgi:hypothetical protein
VTSYTTNRGYPYPSSEREGGNGGLHSELLARAVAADLDVVDAEWAALLQRPSIILSMTSDLTGLSTGGIYGVSMSTVDKQVGTDVVYSGTGVRAAKPGWYHITAQLRSKASGTITAAAQHRVQLEHVKPVYGSLATVQMYYTETFQAGSLDNYLMIDVVVHLLLNEEVRMRFFHTNTGSTATVVAAGTRLTAAQIVRD